MVGRVLVQDGVDSRPDSTPLEPWLSFSLWRIGERRLDIAAPQHETRRSMSIDALFQPFTLKSLTLKNRTVMAPMTRSFSPGGVPTEDVAAYYARRARNEVGLIISEGTGVARPASLNDPNVPRFHGEAELKAWKRVIDAVHAEGGKMAPQLWHVGAVRTRDPEWTPPGPYDSPSGFSSPGKQFGEAMTDAEVADAISAFARAAKDAKALGFDAIELHGAHGYLIHEFLSPASNKRTDSYGGTFENRTRFVLEVIDATREVWPERLPLFLRLSATEWSEGGWTLEETIRLSAIVKSRGIDLIDCSSGGNIPGIKIPIGPGYQTPLAESVRKGSGILTGAVGLITSPAQADHIVRTGQADVVFLARELLRDPYFPRRAAKELGHEMKAPNQYARAW